ncbi:Pentatricopeptide repeat-containing protein [Spatholobus suberectus]|nr:Pentatricopeptide repeat-containing protein [Spatholobus suberectus]
MIGQNLLPQSDTMVSVLSACSSLETPKIEKWVNVLSELIDDSMSVRENCYDSINTVLVYLLARARIGDLSFGSWVHEYLMSLGHQGLDKAKEVFERPVSKDVVLFNAMIMGLVVYGEGEDALRLLYKMPEFGLQPNAEHFLVL